MTTTHSESIDRQPSTSVTLGDVLRGNGAAAVHGERDWLGLVRSIAAGDERALGTLCLSLERVVFTLAFRATHDPSAAEELTLDVFHAVWLQAASYDPANSSVIGWVASIARSKAMERAGDVMSAGLRPSQRTAALRRALTELTLDERQAIETAYFAGVGLAEIAARLGQSPAAVKDCIASGFRTLERSLTERAP